MNIPRQETGKSRRRLRVEEQIKRILGEILSTGAKDPRIGFVSVTRVETTADLKQARVCISVLGEEEEVRRALEGLRSARGYFQRELGRRMSTRYTPVISFSFDDSLQYSDRINRLFDRLHEGEEERDEGSPSPDQTID